ncbi:MAG: GNAT family N-acetyltransferase [Paracoccaceae bacterium]
MRLRDATVADAPALARVMGDWIRDTPWMPKLHTKAQDLIFVKQLITTRVVRMEDSGLGFLARQDGEVDALYLAPHARGQGLGKALLDEAKAAEEMLTLWAFQANEGARRFYAREGFIEAFMTNGDGNLRGLKDVRLVWERDLF